MDLFLSIFVSLFSVLNPLGTVPVFVGLTKNDTKENQNKTAVWTSINVLIILLISLFIGDYLLAFFGISINSLRIAGGLIIISSGFALLTGTFTKHKGMKKSSVQVDLETRSEVSLTPLAIPMLAGPGSISMLIAYKQTFTSNHQVFLSVLAITAVCLCIFLLLRSSKYIVTTLGASGINAVSRIIGFIVIAIGVEYISVGICSLIQSF